MNETLRSALSSWLAAQSAPARQLVSHGLAAPSGSWPACETAAMPPSLTKLVLKFALRRFRDAGQMSGQALPHYTLSASSAHNCSMLSCGRARELPSRISRALARPVAHDRCPHIRLPQLRRRAAQLVPAARVEHEQAPISIHEHPSGAYMIGRNKIAVFALVRTSRLPQHVRNFVHVELAKNKLS